MAQLSYLEAISDALRVAMGEDERVILLGEDIGVHGGAFKVTDGLLAEFGADRVIDTPICEEAIVGGAVGAAIVGMRPVCEMQFADFVACAFDQIVNVAGKLHYRLGVAVPIVVRLPSGGGFSGGPYHSQNPEAWFLHSPGLKVLAPSSAEDAKGLLLASIRDSSPVLFFEHKRLYRSIKGEVPEGDYTVPIGKAAIRREGSDLTIISYGFMVTVALEAAEAMSKRGVEAEVIDLRTLSPLDKETILESVRKTNKVLIVHEDKKTMGIGAELAAIITEEAFDHLDGPVMRVTGPDIPSMPFSPNLEKYFLVNPEKVVAAIEQLAAY